ncbi:arginyl-tRNA synthetase [Oceanibacterium hippocampi]|uniref:Arginyl-tRNA synthetase n=1 Tax=Oceanibacterium hippocampi TaxID=745714 RepID=A0A1Y5TYX9_9PROT|nr:arginyl-tRNA synthetase [Oceanibacterium hippocampi]
MVAGDYLDALNDRLGAATAAVLPGLGEAVSVEARFRPSRPGRAGDLSSRVALRLAGEAGMAAMDLADAIADRFTADGGPGRPEAVAPGYLNLHLPAACWLRETMRLLDGMPRARITAPVTMPPETDGPAHPLALLRRDVRRRVLDNLARLHGGAGRPVAVPVLPPGLTPLDLLGQPPEAGVDELRAAVADRGRHNPAFLVPYADARAASLLGGAAMPSGDGAAVFSANELALMKQLAGWPRVLAGALVAGEPERLPVALLALARTLLAMIGEGGPVRDPAALTTTRHGLLRAFRYVVADAMMMLDMTATESAF